MGIIPEKLFYVRTLACFRVLTSTDLLAHGRLSYIQDQLVYECKSSHAVTRAGLLLSSPLSATLRAHRRNPPPSLATYRLGSLQLQSSSHHSARAARTIVPANDNGPQLAAVPTYSLVEESGLCPWAEGFASPLSSSFWRGIGLAELTVDSLVSRLVLWVITVLL